jgi:hypothetical protein
MLAAKMFVIQTRNYIPAKIVKSKMRIKLTVNSVLFSILPKWHVIKTKLPATRGESNPGLTEPASMFVIVFHSVSHDDDFETIKVDRIRKFTVSNVHLV